jgi:hypothetical protein
LTISADLVKFQLLQVTYWLSTSGRRAENIVQAIHK